MMNSEKNPFHNFWRRFFAGIIDGLVAWSFELIFVLILYPVQYFFPIIKESWLSILFLMLARNSAYFIYNIILHGRYGQTLGKMLMKIRIMDISQSSITMKHALRRDIVPIFFTLLIISIITLLNVADIQRGVNNLSNVPISEAISFGLIILSYAQFTWFLVEIFSMLTNVKQRAFQDLIAGTIVIRTEYFK